MAYGIRVVKQEAAANGMKLMPGARSIMPEGYVSASCNRKDHGRCSVLKCTCGCHGGSK